MPFVTPVLADVSNADNTGDYKGYKIRVKGDGRVQSVDGEDSTFMHRNVINAKAWIDERGGGAPTPGPDPEPGQEPTLNSINPSGASIEDPEFTLHVTGQRFTETSIIYFNGGAEYTTFVDDGKLTTTVKPSLVTVAIEVPVWVQQGSFKTAEKTFSFVLGAWQEPPPE